MGTRLCLQEALPLLYSYMASTTNSKSAGSTEPADLIDTPPAGLTTQEKSSTSSPPAGLTAQERKRIRNQKRNLAW